MSELARIVEALLFLSPEPVSLAELAGACEASESDVVEALAALRSRQHEVLFLHLLGRDEIEFPFSGPARFEEWETGDVFETDATTARTTWLENLQRSLDDWRTGWDAKRFEYVQIRTDEPVDRALRTYLLRRMKR